MTERFLVFFVFALIAWAVIFGGAHLVSNAIGKIMSLRRKEAGEVARVLNTFYKGSGMPQKCHAVMVRDGILKRNFPDNEEEVIAIGKSGNLYIAFHESGSTCVIDSEYAWPPSYWAYGDCDPGVKTGWYEKIKCMSDIGCAEIDEEIVAFIRLPKTEKSDKKEG